MEIPSYANEIQEYFSGGVISCCFQMKTDKIKCFPRESVRNCSARSLAPFILNVPPECCSICSEHLGESLASISQMTEPTEREDVRASSCMGKMALCSLLVKQAFLSLLLPSEAVLEQREIEKARRGKPQGEENEMRKDLFFFLTFKILNLFLPILVFKPICKLSCCQ